MFIVVKYVSIGTGVLEATHIVTFYSNTGIQVCDAHLTGH
jgi:hypothetical protein